MNHKSSCAAQHDCQYEISRPRPARRAARGRNRHRRQRRVRKLIASLTEEYVRTRRSHSLGSIYGTCLMLFWTRCSAWALQPLLEDPAISEVMITIAPVFVERSGRVMLSPVVFESDAQLRQVIDRVVSTWVAVSTRAHRCATRACATARGSTSSCPARARRAVHDDP